MLQPISIIFLHNFDFCSFISLLIFGFLHFILVTIDLCSVRLPCFETTLISSNLKSIFETMVASPTLFKPHTSKIDLFNGSHFRR